MKVDDKFHASEKLNSIPKRHRFAAAGLWAVAGSWVAGQETDGFVPDYMIRVWGPTQKTVESLVNAGLWKEIQGGYIFNSWLKYNPSKEDSAQKRAASAERMAKTRERRRRERAGSGVGIENVAAQQDEVLRRNDGEVLHCPDPTRPDPTHKKEEKQTKKRNDYPADFEEWYEIYPRHVGKADALKAWKVATKKITRDDLNEATRRWAQAYEASGKDPNYIPHPATWLRRGGWDDELPTPELLPAQRKQTDLDQFLSHNAHMAFEEEPPF